MGTYYLYVNETRKEYFYVDPTGQKIKWGCVGNNFGSRILSLLLLDDPDSYTGLERHKMIGSWVGERFRITGDEFDPGIDEIEQTYKNIENDVIDMMSRIDPYSFFDCHGADWLVYYAAHMDTIPDSVRRRLLKFYRGLHHDRPNDEYSDIVASLRPKRSPDGNAG